MCQIDASFIRTWLKLDQNVEIIKIRKESTDDGCSRTVVEVEPTNDVKHRCSRCGQIGTYYDTPRPNDGPKEWRTLPLGSEPTFLSNKPHRIKCPKCGVVTADVPWAAPNSGCTKQLDDYVAWHALHMNKESITFLTGMEWDTVWRSIERTIASVEGDMTNRLNNLVEIGIDENAYGRGYDKFVMVVYNHKTKEVVWVKEGRSSEVISSFFKELTEEQRAKIKFVTVDGAEWIHDVVKEYCPNAKICLDYFHVFQWISEAANEVRSDIYKDKMDIIKDLKNARKDLKEESKESNSNQINKTLKKYDNAISTLEDEAELLKTGKHLITANPDNLSPENLEKQKNLISIDPKLQKIYNKIQDFRDIMDSGDRDYAETKLDKFIKWCRGSKFDSFNKLSNTLYNFKTPILNTAQYGFSNGMVETTNNTIKFIIRQSYGFRNIDNLITSIKFRCSKRYLKILNRNPRRILRSEWHTVLTYNTIAV